MLLRLGWVTIGCAVLSGGCGDYLLGLEEHDWTCVGPQQGVDFPTSRTTQLETFQDVASVRAGCAACDERPLVAGESVMLHVRLPRAPDDPVAVEADRGVVVELGPQRPCDSEWSRTMTIHLDEPGPFDVSFIHGAHVIDSVRLEAAEAAELVLEVRDPETDEWIAPAPLEAVPVSIDGTQVRATSRDASGRVLDDLERVEWSLGDPELVLQWGTLFAPINVGATRVEAHLQDLSSQAVVLRVDEAPAMNP